MSDDLVRRLACPYPKDEDVEEVTLPVWVILLTTEAADRIEELEGQLQSVLDRETSILRYYDAKLDAAESNLEKAVDKTLDAANEYMIAQYGISALGHPLDRNRILAELKGEQP